MATCRICDREFVYDDDHGYSRDVCSPICDGIEIGASRGTKGMERLRNALDELTALVRGECPSLLSEDSGGNARLAIEIDECLLHTNMARDVHQGRADSPANLSGSLFRRFDLVQAHGCGELIGEMHEVADGDFVKYEDAANLLDTIKACLVAAGGSEDDTELEKQCYMAGTKPSNFIAAQFHGFETYAKNLRFMIELLPRLIHRLSETDQAMFVVACREAPVSTCFCGAHWSQLMDWKLTEMPAAIQTWECGCGAVNGVNLATCRVCNRREGEK